MSITVVFVHGWSVTNLDTYGELPIRLKAEAQQQGIDIEVNEIFLGRYISFHDEVGLEDISRAFDTAVKEQLNESSRFICITHSTGGPIIREWWNNFYKNVTPPLSHLIMLAPANFGSALAILGKGTLSRIKTWFEGIEPGKGVLDWLECGSADSWQLNKEWISSDGNQISPAGVFPFVITGQSIDRKLYDHLNSYTGELGSDGVIRASSANLNSRYIKLIQEADENGPNQIIISPELKVVEYKESPVVPYRIIKGKSHSGNSMGIMKSVKKEITDSNSKDTVNAILDCIKVTDKNQYNLLIKQFDNETHQVQTDELIEHVDKLFATPRHFIHDRFSQIIFRVTDSQGYPVKDYDLIFTAGEKNDANHLPSGFAIDRQQNKNNPETITYYFNYDVMKGAPQNEFRDKLPEANLLGLKVNPRPTEGFVRFVPCHIVANADLLDKALKPNSTTLIDIVIQRVVSKEVFKLEKLVGNTMPSSIEGNFKRIKPGNEIVR
ncbi:MAG: phospholipase [Bacteroidales bacterium]|nr:phospholipase [Bacteroidales bacterium]